MTELQPITCLSFVSFHHIMDNILAQVKTKHTNKQNNIKAKQIHGKLNKPSEDYIV